jgi:hypothetical protein
MTFGLKNVGATCKREMYYIFHELIDKTLEIYIDDAVVKLKGYREHLEDLKKNLECAKRHGLRLNPHKCAFGVSAGQFLGFMVHDKRIEVGQKSFEEISKIVPPT